KICYLQSSYVHAYKYIYTYIHVYVYLILFHFMTLRYVHVYVYIPRTAKTVFFFFFFKKCLLLCSTNGVRIDMKDACNLNKTWSTYTVLQLFFFFSKNYQKKKSPRLDGKTTLYPVANIATSDIIQQYPLAGLRFMALYEKYIDDGQYTNAPHMINVSYEERQCCTHAYVLVARHYYIELDLEYDGVEPLSENLDALALSHYTSPSVTSYHPTLQGEDQHTRRMSGSPSAKDFHKANTKAFSTATAADMRASTGHTSTMSDDNTRLSKVSSALPATEPWKELNSLEKASMEKKQNEGIKEIVVSSTIATTTTTTITTAAVVAGDAKTRETRFSTRQLSNGFQATSTLPTITSHSLQDSDMMDSDTSTPVGVGVGMFVPQETVTKIGSAVFSSVQASMQSPRPFALQAPPDTATLRQPSTRSDATTTTSYQSRFGDSLERELKFGYLNVPLNLPIIIFKFFFFFFFFICLLNDTFKNLNISYIHIHICIYVEYVYVHMYTGGIEHPDPVDDFQPNKLSKDSPVNGIEVKAHLQRSSATQMSQHLREVSKDKHHVSREKHRSSEVRIVDDKALSTPKGEKSRHLSVLTKPRESWSGTMTKTKQRSVMRSLSIFLFPGNFSMIPSQKVLLDYQNRPKAITEDMADELVHRILDALDGCLLAVFRNMRKPFHRFRNTAVSVSCFYLCFHIITFESCNSCLYVCAQVT
ncbi:hypothetical protein RFI_30778, partial [Reticulomyxa filosa]